MPKRVNIDNRALTDAEIRTPRERKTKTSEQALRTLMNLCAKSEKSSGDALRLMARWGVPPSERSKVLSTLVAQRFIDDHRYAGAYVREKSRLSGWGAYKIRAALAAKGIAREIIDEALAQCDRSSSAERLAEMLRRKRRSLREVGYPLKGKLMRYGLSLGYEYDAVVAAVEKLMDQEDDNTLE